MMSRAVDAAPSPRPSEDMLMTRRHKEALSHNRDSLVENMYPDDILNRLQSKKVLTQRDVTRIKEKPAIDSQNEALLDVLMRKPDKAFSDFLESLRETDQGHVANILDPSQPTFRPNLDSAPVGVDVRRGGQLSSEEEDGLERDVEGSVRRRATARTGSLSQARRTIGVRVDSHVHSEGDADANLATPRSRPRRRNRNILQSNQSARAEELTSQINEEILETSLVELQNLRDIAESGISVQTLGARSKILETLSSLQKFRREIMGVYDGSVVFRVFCPSLLALDDLWSMYRSGELLQMFSSAFITPELLGKLNLGTVSVGLTVSIKKKEYLQCRQEFPDAVGKENNVDAIKLLKNRHSLGDLPCSLAGQRKSLLKSGIHRRPLSQPPSR